jgi:hypothetical protein
MLQARDLREKAGPSLGPAFLKAHASTFHVLPVLINNPYRVARLNLRLFSIIGEGSFHH